MIELPEAFHIAREINDVLAGKTIRSATRGNAPHKFAFYSAPPEVYARALRGQTIVGAYESGSLIVIDVGPEVIVLGGGGERITYHAAGRPLPARHQLLLEFDDGTSLTVTVQGWGSCLLIKPHEIEARTCSAGKGLPPTDPGFTRRYFAGLFAGLEADDARSVKAFMITKPGVWGIGNGYLQDICFRARVNPRARAAGLTAAERDTLYRATVGTIREAIGAHGRDDELDLFGNPGMYVRILSAATAGRPCPACGERIVKEAFLGGAIYYCPECQPKPAEGSRRRKAAASA